MFVHAKARISRKAAGSDTSCWGGPPFARHHGLKLHYSAEECQDALADLVVFARRCRWCVRSRIMIHVTSDSVDTPRRPRLCQATGDLQDGRRSVRPLWSEEAWPDRALRSRSTSECGALMESTGSDPGSLAAPQDWPFWANGDSLAKQAIRKATFADMGRQYLGVQQANWRSCFAGLADASDPVHEVGRQFCRKTYVGILSIGPTCDPCRPADAIGVAKSETSLKPRQKTTKCGMVIR